MTDENEIVLPAFYHGSHGPETHFGAAIIASSFRSNGEFCTQTFNVLQGAGKTDEWANNFAYFATAEEVAAAIVDQAKDDAKKRSSV